MVMGGFEVYRVYCVKCDWEDEYTVRKQYSLIDFPLNDIPGKCPKCGAKTQKEKLPVLF